MSAELQSLIDTFLASRSASRRQEVLCSLLDKPASRLWPTIRRFAVSADTRERLLAAGLMGELGYPNRPHLNERLRRLKQLALHDASAKVRARAVLSLAFTHAPDALPIIVQLKSDRSIVVRKSVAEACAYFDDRDAFDALVAMIDDDSPAVCEYVVIAMGFMHACRRDAIAVLRDTSLTWPDTTIHEAIHSRIRLGDDEVLSALAELCESQGLSPVLIDALFDLPYLHENGK